MLKSRKQKRNRIKKKDISELAGKGHLGKKSKKKKRKKESSGKEK